MHRGHGRSFHHRSERLHRGQQPRALAPTAKCARHRPFQDRCILQLRCTHEWHLCCRTDSGRRRCVDAERRSATDPARYQIHSCHHCLPDRSPPAQGTLQRHRDRPWLDHQCSGPPFQQLVRIRFARRCRSSGTRHAVHCAPCAAGHQLEGLRRQEQHHRWPRRCNHPAYAPSWNSCWSAWASDRRGSKRPSADCTVPAYTTVILSRRGQRAALDTRWQRRCCNRKRVMQHV